ncbi:hypothetical protein NQ314_004436 [Rhamnusium bicolor]|uniref:Uncharacterized protein n=1 Tax=Rhamnusium bicolor TaxID=1586634 RepID=A0AAV8ZL48_9CUCU|nr:hypothetical protein NQ314_004436 [Rhamnusium bicolor]
MNGLKTLQEIITLDIKVIIYSRTWGVTSTDPKFQYYLDFVETVANATYISLNEFHKYQDDTTLKDIDMVELAAKYYLHSYLDIVHITYDLFHELGESEELEINYRMIETMSSPALRYLTPSQRRCRFDDEPLTHEVPVYSTSLCYVICRYKLALKLCGCKPFFYHFLAGKVCDIKGLMCLSKYADNITQSPSQIGCKCPQPCDLIVYLPQIPKYTKWEYGYFDQRITFRWGLLPPTTKYRRDILFWI